MKRPVLIAAALVAAVLLSLAGAWADSMVRDIQVMVNGRVTTVASVRMTRGYYLESGGVSRAFGVNVSTGPGQSMKLAGRDIEDCPLVAGRRFINANDIGQALGYRVNATNPQRLLFTGGSGLPPFPRTGTWTAGPRPTTGSPYNPRPSSGSPYNPRPAVSPVPDAPAYPVSINVTKKERAVTSSPTDVMYVIEAEVANLGDKSIQVSNNQFRLRDENGRIYRVNRVRYAREASIMPGQKAGMDRIFFTVPRDARVTSLLLYRGGKLTGRTDF